jgi:hypothetical protein
MNGTDDRAINEVDYADDTKWLPTLKVHASTTYFDGWYVTPPIRFSPCS